MCVLVICEHTRVVLLRPYVRIHCSNRSAGRVSDERSAVRCRCHCTPCLLCKCRAIITAISRDGRFLIAFVCVREFPCPQCGQLFLSVMYRLHAHARGRRFCIGARQFMGIQRTHSICMLVDRFVVRHCVRVSLFMYCNMFLAFAPSRGAQHVQFCGA